MELNDEELRAAIDDIANSTKGPIELALAAFEATLIEKVREADRYGLHRSRENKAATVAADAAHDDARELLALALFEAGKRLKGQRKGFIDDLNDIKNTVMFLYPRSKL